MPILRLIWTQELSVGVIAEHCDVSWPAVSQNLKVLREAGLIVERRQGNRRFYRADPSALGSLRAAVEEMWSADLDSLRDVVGEG